MLILYFTSNHRASKSGILLWNAIANMQDFSLSFVMTVEFQLEGGSSGRTWIMFAGSKIE
jgi:hypothetical protein